MPVFNNVLAGAAGQGGDAGYKIERSLRFDKTSQSHLSRTFGGADRKKWTLSFWYKPCIEGSDRRYIFTARNSQNHHSIINFDGGDNLEIYHYNGGSLSFQVRTQARFRDPSAWYHFVIAYDTTIASPASDRIKIWVNGVRVTEFAAANFPSQNADVALWNDNNTPHQIGRDGSTYTSLYLAEVHFIDSIVTDETAFGKFDNNGVWQPIEYTGIYNSTSAPLGVNGFYLDFSDNSSDSALGNDAVGSNNWSVNNLTASVPTLTATTGAGALDASIFNGSNTKTYWRNPITITGIAVQSGAGLGYRGVVESGNSTPNHTIKKNGTVIGSFTGVVGNNNWLASTNYTVREGAISQSISPSDTIEITTDVQAWHGADQITINGSPIVQPSKSGTDSLIDSPTNYEADSGNNVGNYPTWNPLDNGGSLVLSNGNLDAADTNNNQHRACRATQRIPNSGKWYFECTITAFSNTFGFGISNSTVADPELATSGSRYLLVNTGGNVQRYDGSAWTEFFNQSGLGNGASLGSVLQVAVDQDAGKLWFGLNNIWLGTTTSAAGNPSNGTNPTLTGTFTDSFPVINCVNCAGAANFGQREFSYTPPTDFKSLCTQNLDDPPIKKGSAHFDVIVTPNGTGADRTFTMPGGFGPDLVWTKSRSNSYNHVVFDTLRGAKKVLQPNLTNAESTSNNQLKSFTSDGFVNGSDIPNTSGESGIYWAWDAGNDANPTSISVGGLNSSLYDQSTTWSSLMSGHWQNAASAFDANGTTYAEANSGATIEIDLSNNSITATSRLQVLNDPGFTGSTDVQYKIYTTSSSTPAFTKTIGGTQSFDEASSNWSSAAITKITVRGLNEGARISKVIYDGKTLVNNTTTPPNVPSIASTVRANQTAGFSIVSYTGNSTAGSTIAHNLNAQPSFIIVKNRDRVINWAVGHLAANTFVDGDLNINTTNSKGTGYIGFFGANPTSNVFTVNNNYESNYANEDYIAYCFAPVEGYSAFTSHTVRSGTNFVYLGFRPRFLMLKRTGDGSTTNMGFASWAMFDTERDTFNEVDFDTILYSNVNHAEGKRGDGNATTGGTYLNIDILSNGFRFQSGAAEFSQPSDEIIVMAWAEHPFKTARAR